MQVVRVKLCGTTSAADRDLAAEFGADCFGVVVEVSWSRRSVSVARAAELLRGSPIPGVLLFCDAPADQVSSAASRIEPFAVQLQGSETPADVERLSRHVPCEVWKALHLPAAGTGKVRAGPLLAQAKEFIAAGAHKLLLDSTARSEGVTRLGGTGLVHDWPVASQIIESISCPTWLSGGISPANVEDALERVRPYGVDLASGVEAAKGKRDREKVKRLMEAVRRWATSNRSPVS